MKTSEFELTMADGFVQHIRLWSPEEDDYKGILLVLHGAAEHGGRYENFADFMTSNGYIVCVPDHRGHGLSVQNEDDLGYFSDDDGWSKIIEDVNALILYLKERFAGRKLYLMGHSMGSFLARTYAIRHGEMIDALILSGTAHNPKGILSFGKSLAVWDIKAGKARKRSPRINKMAFLDLNKCFKDGKTGFEWLSRDSAVCEKFAADKLCGFNFTSSAFRDMFSGLLEITDMSNIEKMPKALPVLLIAGKCDPVGGFGKMVLKCDMAFKAAGLRDVTLKLYDGMRHEVLNELGKEEVYHDILNWLKKVG
ncbi:Monoacylglycerol lipase [bioreactor metagenome]|uniref:Monoacylglycerol lipase n=1 Tax=bioreactor metagenome TaxID=1076179 RepID=A0A645A8F6_9ZZZZ